MKKCVLFKHLVMTVMLFNTYLVQAKSETATIGRAPASYIVNDDLIVKPFEVEKNFFTELSEKHASSFDKHRSIVENWKRNEELETMYGLEGRGVFKTSTLEQRQRFVQRNYLRFVSKKIERNANSGIADWWNRRTEDDEIDSIKNVISQEKKITETKKSLGMPGLKSTGIVKSGSDKVKFNFRPYIEMGMVKVSMDSDYFNAKGWFGINGNQEFNVQKFIKSTNTRFIYNYYIDQQRSLAVIDQNLTKRVSLRYTHNKSFDKFGSIARSGLNENNIFQIRFGMGF